VPATPDASSEGSALATNGIELVFLRNEAGEDEGLGHAGIETYRDAPYSSVARECGQNSMDAAAGHPVEMSFDRLVIPVADYPVHAAEAAAVSQCLQKAQAKADEKEIEFFGRARTVLARDTISLLRISDRNTRGLTGPSEPGTPFHSLVKSSGVSSKESESSGGSFGIGKNAAFAVSELQTVFYSTVYKDPDRQTEDFLAQGKTILISHADGSGEERRATGYWGLPGFAPIAESHLVPDWMRRTEIGTSVIVAGFRDSEHWGYRIAESLLQNFFCAVHRGEIRFLVDEGQIEITRESLRDLFNDPKITQAAKDADDFEDFEFARHLYECLVAPDAIRKDLEIKGIGPVSVTMLVRDGLPKRVRIVRNGMAITDELSNFGDKFAVFPMYRDFVALVEPGSSDGSKFVKRLENPRHDGLSAERLADPQKRREASLIMKRLAKEIRQAIKDEALPKFETTVALDELTEFFDDRDPADKPPQTSNEENPEVLVYKPVDPRRTDVGADTQGGQGRSGGGGTGRGRGGKGRGRGSGTGRGRGGRGRKGGGQPVQLADVRNVLVAAGGGANRRLYFTPDESCHASVTVLAAGMDQPAQLTVTTVDTGHVQNGSIVLDVTGGQRTSLLVAFGETYDGPIELVASRVTTEEAA
jgi:hypothetical protein